jgi:parallel beta-helix repeat protein
LKDLAMTTRDSGRPAAIPNSRIPRLETLEARDVPSASFAAASAPRVLAVHQGNPHARFHTIQAAVNAARPGDTILVYSGIYRESITVMKNNLSIDAAPGASVIIQNPGQMSNGITVVGAGRVTLTGFTLAGVTVKGFFGSGVFLLGVAHFEISHVVAANNMGHGIEVVLSSSGSINNSTAYGSNNSGIEVSQSHNVLLTNENVHGNTNGIEVLNSTRVTTSNSSAFDNTVGILVDQLPGAAVAMPGHRPVQNSSYNIVENNSVYANNLPNAAASTGLASADPPGAGILIVGGDHTLVQDNQVYSNGYGGIVLIAGIDWFIRAPVGTPGYARGINARPVYTLIENNNLWFNGFLSGAPGWPGPADLVWTGLGLHNHWRRNLFTTSTLGILP